MFLGNSFYFWIWLNAKFDIMGKWISVFAHRSKYSFNNVLRYLENYEYNLYTYKISHTTSRWLLFTHIT